MDTELARTFLVVVAERSFSGAAARLNLTQSAVSIRIKTLEERIGRKLFNRAKGGIGLTEDGQRFQKHASILIRAVERAMQDLSGSPEHRKFVSLGARFGVWESFLHRAMAELQVRMPQTRIRSVVGFEEDLTYQVVEGALDLALMYTPQSRSMLRIEHLLTEDLVMVSTRKAPHPDFNDDYVLVEWGADFLSQHSLAFPEFTDAKLTSNLGWLGLRQVLDSGGSGYFPFSLVDEHLAAGRLFLVEGAPRFELPAYVVFPRGPISEDAETAVREIHKLAQEYSGAAVSSSALSSMPQAWRR